MNYKMKYEAECKRILQTYPEQMKKVFSYPDCELESDFLGFVDEYAEEQIPEDFTKVYAICSYVPDEEAQKLVADTFPYAKIVYCHENIMNRKPPVLNFYNCLYLLGEMADHNLIKYDPNDHDRVLVYRAATKDNPAGWYSENIHTIAQELVNRTYMIKRIMKGIN